MEQSPDTVLNPDDPGDDVQRRFRFQATAAAIWSLSLFDDQASLHAVYCELHEDVLLHKRGGRFVGIQIKTKLDNLVPHRATDDEVVGSIKRFVALQEKFGTLFDGYRISSNVGFWDEGASATCLPHILRAAEKDDGDGTCPPVVANYLKKIFPPPKKPRVRKHKSADDGSPTDADRLAAYQAEETRWNEVTKLGRAVLKMLRLDKLPGLADARVVLVHMLPKCALVGDRLHSELSAIADALIEEMLKAGSITHDSIRDRYLIVFDKPDEIAASEKISGKCVNCERLQLVLSNCLTRQPTLTTNAPVSVADLPSGLTTMEAKMAAGAISIGNIDLAKDLKASTESLLVGWLYREGKGLADRRYQHLRTLVRSESQEAFDLAFRDDASFGPAMLSDLRTRLRRRYGEDPGSFFGCAYEHLMGMAGILTEDCTLWWSKPFEIPTIEVAK